MPSVTDQIYHDIGSIRGQSEEEYAALIESYADQNTAPIFSEEGKSYLAQSLAQNTCGETSLMAAIIPVAEWRYAKIDLDGSIIAEAVFCPPAGIQHTNLPPTSAETLLLDAWMIGASSAIHGFSGSVIVRIFNSVINKQAISSLLGTLNCRNVANLSSHSNSWLDEKSSARLDNASRFLNKPVSYSRLLDTALSELNKRWRFLQFYRILEQGYLDTILSSITANFLQEPKLTLKQAENSIGSELKQLEYLILSGNLQVFFEFIWGDLEEIENSGNKFAYQINAKASSGGARTLHDRGAAAIYAIRCAIAHAGVRDIYYEQYPDADDAVARILPTFEEAVMRFLGIELSA